jgi:hypothetical protein
MAMTLITTNTSSGAATSDFTTGIDNTYKLYIFKFIDINPATDSAEFTFQANAAGASGYNETMTTTVYKAAHNEADDSTEIAYDSSFDQAQGTAFQSLSLNIGNGGDESCAGTMWLFNPSNTTYVKHFYSTLQSYHATDAAQEVFTAGYMNTTTAIDDIQFKMSSGNMDGVIKMYGVG